MNRFKKVLANQQLIVTLALVLICLAFSVMTSQFFSIQTFINVSKSAYYIAFMAIGVTFVIATGGIDLSIGTVAICAALIGGTLWENYGLSFYVIIPVILLVGLLFGLMNGILIAHLKLPAFIATLGMMMVSRGLGSIVSATRTINFPQGDMDGAWFREIFMTTREGFLPKNFPTGFILLAILVAVMTLILRKMKVGRYILAIGSNKEATRLSGVDVKRYETIAYVISGLFAGLAGLAYVGVFIAAQPNTGNGFELDAIAGVVIGGTSLAGGTASIVGTIIGVFIMTVLKIGFPYLGVQPHWQLFITGIILIIAVFVDIINRSKNRRVS